MHNAYSNSVGELSAFRNFSFHGVEVGKREKYAKIRKTRDFQGMKFRGRPSNDKACTKDDSASLNSIIEYNSHLESGTLFEKKLITANISIFP